MPEREGNPGLSAGRMEVNSDVTGLPLREPVRFSMRRTRVDV
jgi:hypothetical protein